MTTKIIQELDRRIDAYQRQESYDDTNASKAVALLGLKRWLLSQPAPEVSELVDLGAVIDEARHFLNNSGHSEYKTRDMAQRLFTYLEAADSRIGVLTTLIGDTQDFLKYLIAGKSQYYHGDKLMANGMHHALELDQHIKTTLPEKGDV